MYKQDLVLNSLQELIYYITQATIQNELLVFDSHAWKHLTVCKQISSGFLSLRVFGLLSSSLLLFPRHFRCLSNSGTFTELQITSFIESAGVACSDPVNHNRVKVAVCRRSIVQLFSETFSPLDQNLPGYITSQTPMQLMWPHFQHVTPC